MKYTGSLFDVTIVAKIIVEWMTTLYKRKRSCIIFSGIAILSERNESRIENGENRQSELESERLIATCDCFESGIGRANH